MSFSVQLLLTALLVSKLVVDNVVLMLSNLLFALLRAFQVVWAAFFGVFICWLGWVTWTEFRLLGTLVIE